MLPEWPNLRSLGVAVSYREEKGRAPSVDYQYYISSAELTEQAFGEAVRGHWGVESMHWLLDVAMKEDDSQIYRNHAAENMGHLRLMALNMLKAGQTTISIRKKQHRSWMTTAFLEGVLIAGFSSMNKS